MGGRIFEPRSLSQSEKVYTASCEIVPGAKCNSRKLDNDFKHTRIGIRIKKWFIDPAGKRKELSGILAKWVYSSTQADTNFTNWEPTEPVDSFGPLGECVRLNPGNYNAGTILGTLVWNEWADAPCKTKFKFICEFVPDD